MTRRSSTIPMGYQSEPARYGRVIVLCGCGRAKSLDRRLRLAQLVAVAALTAMATAVATGGRSQLSEAGLVGFIGIAVAVTAIAFGVLASVQTAVMARHGFCSKCISPVVEDPEGSQ